MQAYVGDTTGAYQTFTDTLADSQNTLDMIAEIAGVSAKDFQRRGRMSR